MEYKERGKPMMNQNTNDNEIRTVRTKKRLLCFSMTKNKPCNYGIECSYAHSLNEQIIDSDRLELFRMILSSEKVMPLDSSKYKALISFTYGCKKCQENICSGGYNCKYGVSQILKVCRNDLMTGNCLNELESVNVPNEMAKKLGFKQHTNAQACSEGHHLTLRGLLPYSKHLQNQEVIKNKYIPNRIINPFMINKSISDTESSDDDELNDIFMTITKNVSDD